MSRMMPRARRPLPKHILHTGSVEVVCGPMFSGKTEELIRRLRRAEIAGQKVLVVKPTIDDRYDASDVVSHSSLRIQALPVINSSAIRDELQRRDEQRQAQRDTCTLDAEATNNADSTSNEGAYWGIDVLGIDEAQFFDDGIVEVARDMADRGIRVIVAGLDQDYLGNPFGPMPALMAIADDVYKQHAVCMVCGSPAGLSQRVRPHAAALNTDTVVVGGNDTYESRCRRCYVRGIVDAE